MIYTIIILIFYRSEFSVREFLCWLVYYFPKNNSLVVVGGSIWFWIMYIKVTTLCSIIIHANNTYEKDKAKNVLEDKKKEGHENMVKYLINKYNPSSYSCDNDDEQSKLDYCIVDHIHSYLKTLFINIQ